MGMQLQDGQLLIIQGKAELWILCEIPQFLNVNNDFLKHLWAVFLFGCTLHKVPGQDVGKG